MSSSNRPCAACKLLRRKCQLDCIFAPYFPAEDPQTFANVHRIFGASNVGKVLIAIPPHQRQDAVNSLAFEAEARAKDPVHGCVSAISVLQRQILRLEKELHDAIADLRRFDEVCNNYKNTTEFSPHHYHYHQGYSVMGNQTDCDNQQRVFINEYGMQVPATADRSPFQPEAVDADCLSDNI